MKILAAGGGSGGHVTPVVAVVRELRKVHPRTEVRFWCDRKFAPDARSIIHKYDPDLKIETVFSGKFRRYHTLPVWRQLLRPFSIVLPNIRDLFLVFFGLVQSVVKLLIWRPDVVFTKGGFVRFPVGLAAKILKIPLVIHDSDAHPGLTNRLLSRFATAIATGAPLKYYPYPTGISHYVGVPVSDAFRPVSSDRQAALKQKLGLDPKRPMVFITGGGLGAQNINEAVARRLDVLLGLASVVLTCGSGQYDDMRALTPESDSRFQLHAFLTNMPDYLAAADIVVSRAGATTILELAAAAKPTILVPSPYLSAGHQLKNATELADQKAVEVVDELELVENPQLLVDTIAALLANRPKMKQLGEAFHAFAKPYAAHDMAQIILNAVK